MGNLIKRLNRDRSGNFAILTALLAVPLMASVGLAVDLSMALSKRQELFKAADAAAVGAIAERSVGVTSAIQMVGDGPVPDAINDAKDIFKGQLSSGSTVETLTENDIDKASSEVFIDADVRRTGNLMTSVVTFKAKVPTTFMRVLGRDEIDVSGTAKAEYGIGAFIDFYMLLDNTPSMGVAATLNDIRKMENATSAARVEKCAFACHETSNANNNYKIAKDNGIVMRIDTVRKATQQLTDTAAKTMIFPEQFRMGVYTFGAKAEDARLTTVSEMSANLKTVKSLAEAVDLMTIPKQGYNNDQQTSFDTMLTQMNTVIGTVGRGTGTQDRDKVLFFVSDGVGDSYKPGTCKKRTTSGRCQEPIDTSFCKPLKDRGVKIAVLYTTYLPLPNNGWYNSWIKPFQGEIATNMQACATAGYYFEVSPTEGIDNAMNQLFLKVVNRPRISS